MEEILTRKVKGIWVPIEVWEDTNLNWNEKILFLEIDSYTTKDKDCYVSNEYIAKLLHVNETTANKILSSLIKKGYVIKTKFDGRKRFVRSNSKKYALDYDKLDYNSQLKSKEWKIFRKEVFKIKGKKCEICGSTKHLNIHHPFYTKGKLAWQYNPSDMMVLCRYCHKEIHNIK